MLLFIIEIVTFYIDCYEMMIMVKMLIIIIMMMMMMIMIMIMMSIYRINAVFPIVNLIYRSMCIVRCQTSELLLQIIQEYFSIKLLIGESRVSCKCMRCLYM
jgi:hypothetical protein